MLKKILTLCVAVMIAFISGVIFTRYFTIPMKLTMELSWPQNLMVYLKKDGLNKKLMSKSQQNKAALFSLTQFFKPWEKYSSSLLASILTNEKLRFQYHLNRKEYGVNFHQHNQAFYKKIYKNMDLSSYPNLNGFAIIIRNTGIRDLPTNLPAFENPAKNITYPFDIFQRSAIWVGQPLHLLHKSRDGAWYLAHYNHRLGWVPASDTAVVEINFIRKYRQGKFAAFIKDNIPVIDNKNDFLFYSRIGMIFPLIKGNVYVPIWNFGQKKIILSEIKSSKYAYSKYPMVATPHNFSVVINNMLGEPYTWNMLSYRECALTIKDLLMTFGIWLPKSSQDQLTYLPYKNIEHLNNLQRTEFINKKAKPFLTLLGTPGHVALYVGSYKDHLMVFENRWGYHTRDIFGDEGRLIVGKAVINSLQPKFKSSLVDRYLLSQLNKITDLSGYPDTVANF